MDEKSTVDRQTEKNQRNDEQINAQMDRSFKKDVSLEETLE